MSVKTTEEAKKCLDSLKENIKKVIIGNEYTIDMVITTMLAGGHVLLEDTPGTGKTTLAKTVAMSIDGDFSRIQFTPDLMPGDITGTNIMIRDESGSSFHFEKGPVFANIVLADEINRATPKTQSALLEAMQEHCVTVGNTSHRLQEPFFVLATQNPIEQEGTYPLPEAQLDRFMFKILVGFPSKDELKGIVDLTERTDAAPARTLLSGEELLQAREMVSGIKIADPVMDRVLDIVMATHDRKDKYIKEGASPRAAQAIVKAAKAKAFMEGRFNVSFEDIQSVAYPVLRHRIILSFEAVSDGITEDRIITGIMQRLNNAGGAQ